jgi:hypothetical protein
MAKSNAQRQADFRARMKARGFREKLIWVDWEGHAKGAKSQDVPEELTLKQLDGQLKKLTADMSQWDAGRMFSDLAAHARGLRARWELNDNAVKKELERVT